MKVKRIGSSASGMAGCDDGDCAIHFRRKPAPGLQSVASKLTARRAHTMQTAATQAFPDVRQAVQEQSISTLVRFTPMAAGGTMWPSNQSMSQQAHPIEEKQNE